MAAGLSSFFLCFDRRPSFLTQGDVSSRLLCENPVVRDKNFRLVTSLALVSTAQANPLATDKEHPARVQTGGADSRKCRRQASSRTRAMAAAMAMAGSTVPAASAATAATTDSGCGRGSRCAIATSAPRCPTLSLLATSPCRRRRASRQRGRATGRPKPRTRWCRQSGDQRRRRTFRSATSRPPTHCRAPEMPGAVPDGSMLASSAVPQCALLVGHIWLCGADRARRRDGDKRRDRGARVGRRRGSGDSGGRRVLVSGNHGGARRQPRPPATPHRRRRRPRPPPLRRRRRRWGRRSPPRRRALWSSGPLWPRLCGRLGDSGTHWVTALCAGQPPRRWQHRTHHKQTIMCIEAGGAVPAGSSMRPLLSTRRQWHPLGDRVVRRSAATTLTT